MLGRVPEMYSLCICVSPEVSVAALLRLSIISCPRKLLQLGICLLTPPKIRFFFCPSFFFEISKPSFLPISLAPVPWKRFHSTLLHQSTSTSTSTSTKVLPPQLQRVRSKESNNKYRQSIDEVLLSPGRFVLPMGVSWRTCQGSKLDPKSWNPSLNKLV